MLPEEYRVTATDNTYRKFSEFGHMVFEICKWTSTHTDTMIAIFTPLLRAK